MAILDNIHFFSDEEMKEKANETHNKSGENPSVTVAELKAHAELVSALLKAYQEIINNKECGKAVRLLQTSVKKQEEQRLSRANAKLHEFASNRKSIGDKEVQSALNEKFEATENINEIQNLIDDYKNVQERLTKLSQKFISLAVKIPEKEIIDFDPFDTDDSSSVSLNLLHEPAEKVAKELTDILSNAQSTSDDYFDKDERDQLANYLTLRKLESVLNKDVINPDAKITLADLINLLSFDGWKKTQVQRHHDGHADAN